MWRRAVLRSVTPHQPGYQGAGRGRSDRRRVFSWNPVCQYTSNVPMDSPEIHHLLFRWLHVTMAVLWIGHTWSVVFAQHVRQPTADLWMRASRSEERRVGKE